MSLTTVGEVPVGSWALSREKVGRLKFPPFIGFLVNFPGGTTERKHTSFPLSVLLELSLVHNRDTLMEETLQSPGF